MGILKLKKLINKHSLTIFFIVFTVLSVIVVGTYAWFSLAQNFTNEFEFEPYDIRLIKLDRDSLKPLQGAVFELFDENNVSQGYKVTDENGEIALSNLDEAKNYYFKEITPPLGYDIDAANNPTPLFSPQGGDITVYNTQKKAELKIHKSISPIDFEGKGYTATLDDKKIPFEFTVRIGTDPSLSYPYIIKDKDGNALTADYIYPDGAAASDPDYVSVKVSGSIKSGDKLYLRDGETAVISDIPVLTHYDVTEKNYVKYDNEDPYNFTDNNFGCENPATQGHDKEINKASGWASYGDNNVGNIAEEGSVVKFSNVKIKDNFKVTMSSLVVVDRILANEADIDYKKGFEVTVVVGEDPNQTYYYEVVHIEEAREVVDGYDEPFTYYYRNDPGVPEPLDKQEVDKPKTFMPFALPPTSPSYVDVWGENAPNIPFTEASVQPLHMPRLDERWPRRDGDYQQHLLVSTNNTIKVGLHHASAVIIYGIPVLTDYSVEQVDYKDVDGYFIDSTVKTYGKVAPDLNTVPDPDSALSSLSPTSALTRSAKKIESLLRTRADIYNYFRYPVMRTIEFSKNWDNDDDPHKPESVEIHLYDAETYELYDSRTLLKTSDWADSAQYLKYHPNTAEKIKYTVAETLPPNYIMTYKETDKGFEIINTYAPGKVRPQVEKIIEGTPPAGAEFTFEINALTSGAPIPPKKTVTISGEGIADFGYITFNQAGKTYEYDIFEHTGRINGCTYDTSRYIMVVETKADANGGVVAEYHYKKNGVTLPQVPMLFKNKFAKLPKTSLFIRKSVTGVGIDKNKRFSFTAKIGGTTKYFTLAHNETIELADIDIGTAYSITETNYSSGGYILTKADYSQGTVVENGNTVEFVNTKHVISPDEKGSLTIMKTVEGKGADTERMFRFVVTIDGEKQEPVYLKHNTSKSFSNLPEGAIYTVEEDNYTSQGYVTKSSGASGNITQGKSIASFVNTNNMPAEKSSLTISKTVKGSGFDPTKRFDFAVTIGKLKYLITIANAQAYTFTDIPILTPYSITESNYTKEGFTTTAAGSSGTILLEGNTANFINSKEVAPLTGNGNLTITKTVTGKFLDFTKKFKFNVTVGDKVQTVELKHGEKFTIPNIPAGTTYTVAEESYASQDYMTSSTGATGTMTKAGATAAFTNEYVGTSPPKPDNDAVQIGGQKTWEHGVNTVFPQSVTILVMNGSNIVTKKIVTAKENWRYVFNLPKFDALGKEIKYSINEDMVKSYIKAIKGYDITNTYTTGTPNTGNDRVIWIWFFVLLFASFGLRIAVFYRNKRKKKNEER